MKVLNLYAGIGGNRKLWKDVEVTAIELDPEIAAYYKDRFPDDEVIVTDAHQYLLENYAKYGFVWSSINCPSHSRARFWTAKGGRYDPVYPDLKLYEEILFLDNYFDGLWAVENVVPYYKPLIAPSAKIGRHLFWSNFNLPYITSKEADIKDGNIKEWEEVHGFSLDGYSFEQRKDKILRNCVHPETGLKILNKARGIKEESEIKQPTLF